MIFLLMKFGKGGRALFVGQSINGFLTDQEAITLYKLACENTPEKNPIVVEIGSWQGKSTVMLGAGLRTKHDPRLYCIDPFNGDGDAYSQRIYHNAIEQLKNSLEDIFLENLHKARITAFTIPCPGYSAEWSQKLSIAIDLLFIDGNHAYESVLNDYELWAPKLNPGGIIAFHDAYSGHPGPERVFKERIHSPLWKDIQAIGSMGIARKSDDKSMVYSVK